VANKKILNMKYILTCVILAVWAHFISAQTYSVPIWSEKDRATWVDNMLEYRLDSLLPSLMDRASIDMWIIISREYNEDPVMKTMLPSSWLSARRRTILVFFNPRDGRPFEKTAIARYDVGSLLKGAWNMDVYPDQWEALRELIVAKDPGNIGINFSEHTGLADGLVATEKEAFLEALPESFRKRVVSAEKLAIGWLETRSQVELEFYKDLCKLSRECIMNGFSKDFIVAGKTTTDDIVWRLRQLVTDAGLETWFHPSVSIQRRDERKFDHLRSFSGRPKDDVIQFGDLLHVDFGITYNRLHTDQQQHFYVLQPDETEIPKSLNDAFRVSNRVQDILTAQFAVEKSGNQILLNALSLAKNEGITASIYTHPIGFHGHAAGPTIGMWDQQQGVPGAGDYLVYPNTAYSIELNAASEIPEWGKIVRIMLEEDGWYDGRTFQYFSGRQQAIYPLRVRGIAANQR